MKYILVLYNVYDIETSHTKEVIFKPIFSPKKKKKRKKVKIYIITRTILSMGIAAIKNSQLYQGSKGIRQWPIN